MNPLPIVTNTFSNRASSNDKAEAPSSSISVGWRAAAIIMVCMCCIVIVAVVYTTVFKDRSSKGSWARSSRTPNPPLSLPNLMGTRRQHSTPLDSRITAEDLGIQDIPVPDTKDSGPSSPTAESGRGAGDKTAAWTICASPHPSSNAPITKRHADHGGTTDLVTGGPGSSRGHRKL